MVSTRNADRCCQGYRHKMRAPLAFADKLANGGEGFVSLKTVEKSLGLPGSCREKDVVNGACLILETS